MTVSLIKDPEVDEVDADVELDVDIDDDEPKRSRRIPKPQLRKWFGGLSIGPQTLKALAAAALAATALAGALYFLQFRPEQQSDEAAQQQVLQAATDGAVAMLTYSPENLDEAMATAKAHLTGDFLSYYSDFAQQIVAPAAREKEVSTTASVVSAAVTDMNPDSATVLLFINQQTMSNERTEPSLAASTVIVNLTKIDGAWLISEFTPV